MLQLMERSTFALIDFTKYVQAHKRLPKVKTSMSNNHTCNRCFYINEDANHFCTNCGYPQHHGDSELLYQFRIKQRNETLKKNAFFIQLGWILLFVLAALLFTAGIGLFFSGLNNRIFLSILMLISAVLFVMLAWWSFSKPFTALLTAFVIVLTFSTIAIFGYFADMFASVPGIYTLIFCAGILYFLFKGVQGAYKTDLINEEMHVN
jgi:hypothetical protein